MDRQPPRQLRPVVRLAALASLFAAGPAAAASELVLIPEPTKVIILLVLFTLLIFPLNALIFRPIFKSLDERDERIAGARKRAEAVSEDAERAIAKYETAVREVREEAESGRREQLDAARAERAASTARAREAAEREIESHRSELTSSLEGARETLRSGTDALAKEMASRVLGRSLS